MPDAQTGTTVRCPGCAHKITFRGKPTDNGSVAGGSLAAPAKEKTVADEILDWIDETSPSSAAPVREITGADQSLAAGPNTAPKSEPVSPSNNTEKPPVGPTPQPPSQAVRGQPLDVPRKPYRPPPPPPRTKKKAPAANEETVALPEWISPWGTAAFGIGVLSLFLAAITQNWYLTFALAILGIAVVVRDFVVTKTPRNTKDKVWLTLGGVINGGVFLLALFAPGMLNHYWAIDTAAAPPDQNKFEAVSRDRPRERNPLAAGDWVDAATQAILQNDALVRLEAITSGTLFDKGSTSYLLVHFRLANIGREQVIKFDGFSNHSHQPVLKDNSGRSFVFLEQRPRKVEPGPMGAVVAGAPIFDVAGEKTWSLSASGRAECLLVFELGASKVEFPAKLELPASAWGRTGVCRISIAGFFDSFGSNKQ